KYLYLSLIDVLRDATVLSFTGNEGLLFRYSPTSLERVRELASRRSKEEWMFLLDIAFRSERDVLATEFPNLGFELLLLRLANAQGLMPLSALEAGEVPASPSAASPQPAPTFSRKAPPAASTPAPPEASAAAPAAKADARPASREGIAGGAGLWDALKRTAEAKKKVVLTGLLSQMEGETQGGELVISCGNEMILDRLKDPDKWALLLSLVEEAAGRPVPVRLSVSAEKKSPEPDGALISEEGLERKALSDPVVLEALRVFEGSMLVKVQPAPAAVEEGKGEEAEEAPIAEAAEEEEK
ncbi:MAG: hypothetical protein AB1346_11020, partial [Thermodesulfobacteriota bacterium]